jgi:hypothetical protein
VTTGSDNPYPKILVVEGSAPASPAAGRQALFIDSADHHWKRKNSGGTVTDLEAGGGGSAITVDDEGTPLATAATTLDFVGAGVTASGTGATKTITIPGGGGTFSGARVYHNTTAALSAAVVPFNSEDFDTDAYHDTATNNSRLTIPTGKDGYFIIRGYLFTGDATDRVMHLRKNGSNVRGTYTTGSFELNFTTIQSAVAGDYFEVFYDSPTTVGHATNTDQQNTFEIGRLGS